MGSEKTNGVMTRKSSSGAVINRVLLPKRIERIFLAMIVA
jgi:hypothetical protein